jgi:hypothetical protein
MQYFFFYVLFLTLLPQEILSLITYSREELLDIRAMSTLQHYDLEYDFPEADPLFGLPPRTMDWIPTGDPKQRHRRRDRWSVFWSGSVDGNITHCSSILLANVQSFDNEVDEIRARVAFQRDIRD